MIQFDRHGSAGRIRGRRRFVQPLNHPVGCGRCCLRRQTIQLSRRKAERVRVKLTQIILAVVQNCGRICIARRSEHVGTSRGLWSVVMGYVEPGVEPAEQARTEVQEELGLKAPDVWLVRSGPSHAMAYGFSAEL